jgi:hypothetical protein
MEMQERSGHMVASKVSLEELKKSFIFMRILI